MRILPPLYMLLFAALMWLLNQYFPFMTVIQPSIKWLSTAFIVCGLCIDLYSLLLFFRAKTTPHPFHESKTSALVTTGFYRYSRNPMYVGLLFLLIGWGIRLGSATPFLMLPLFIFVITSQQIVKEEKVLRSLFGDEYTEYCARVRRWL